MRKRKKGEWGREGKNEEKRERSRRRKGEWGREGKKEEKT